MSGLKLKAWSGRTSHSKHSQNWLPLCDDPGPFDDVTIVEVAMTSWCQRCRRLKLTLGCCAIQSNECGEHSLTPNLILSMTLLRPGYLYGEKHLACFRLWKITWKKSADAIKVYLSFLGNLSAIDFATKSYFWAGSSGCHSISRENVSHCVKNESIPLSLVVA